MRTRSFSSLSLFFPFAFSLLVVSTNVQAIDLLGIYQEALINDAEYASARAARAAAEEKIKQGRANLLPTVGLSGSRARNDIETTTANGVVTASGVNNSHNYTLSLSQPLLNMANWEQYEQSKLAVASSEAVFAQAQQNLMVRVSQAYFDVLAAQDTLAFVRTLKQANKEQLDYAKRNFEVGIKTITDTHEAQARYDLAVAQELAALNDVAIKRTALQQIIGKEAKTLAALKPGIVMTAPQPVQMEPWVTSAEQKNYSVIGAEIALKNAQRDIAKNRAGHYPTVNLVASVVRNSNSGNAQAINGSSANSNNNAIGIQWSVPLFSGFAVDSKVTESIALEDKARYDLENARRTAAQAARLSYLGVNSGLAQIKALETAETSSLSALASNKLGYEVGVQINIDVLNAQQQLFSTRRDLAKARYDTIMSGLRLKSAAATLKEEDLVLINGLLQR